LRPPSSPTDDKIRTVFPPIFDVFTLTLLEAAFIELPGDRSIERVGTPAAGHFLPLVSPRSDTFLPN
jgi:hypothetical protein